MGVVGIQCASCISCACSPTITSSTTPSMTPVKTSILRYGSLRCAMKVEHRDDRREHESRRHAHEHDAAAHLEPVALQKEHDFESLAVERGEAE